DQRGWSWDFQRSRVLEPGLMQPSADLIERERVALLGGHQHVDPEDQAHGRAGAIVIDEKFGDGDSSAGRERLEHLAQQVSAALLALAVQNMPQGGGLESGAEVHFEQIACYRVEVIRDSV